ncbi:MAG TPA: tRNA isopentenyl-2-thiomethyl-A-37 hydroxylase MiaE [Sorangium sp.]|nr:tRNA isopentenyl-2-thiomethyl-A-37 hydroxylase MiaE [Sorangium sp.]
MLCLTLPTDPRWADVALADLPALLTDHAHCEMKAASNALSLAARWPSIPRLARALVDLAEEELRHFRALLDVIEQRGLALGKPETDEYASELRKAASSTCARNAKAALIDRLLVGAIIEARSCERFRLLADGLAAREHELTPLYEELFASEARHYRTLVDLAVDIAGDEGAARGRLAELARAEGEIARRLGTAAAVHG